MGLLDDAIREHLELKRAHGADVAEVARQEQEAFGPAPVAPEPVTEPEFVVDESTTVLEDAPEPVAYEPPPVEPEPVPEPEPEPVAYEPPPPPPPPPVVETPITSQPTTAFSVEDHLAREAAGDDAPAEDHDELEETPEFLQETPEHDRLWFEQRPPRDFDFDG